MSQEQLARRSGVSARTISDLERGQRTTARLETLRLLADALELDETTRKFLVHASGQSGESHAFPKQWSDASTESDVKSLDRVPHPLTPLLGRSVELAEIHQLIGDLSARIVNLTGPGGIGKTRLALEALCEQEQILSWSCHFVQLAALEAASLVPAEIGKSFGLPDSDPDLLADRIHYLLQDQPCLLVLDNFERLVDASPLLTQLVAACPTLTVLVTSRVRLHVSGEVEYQVRPLALADPDALSEKILDSPAVQLFLERAGMAAEKVSLAELKQISSICGRLDGLPLALELAAAKTRFLTVSDLHRLLAQRLPLLDGGPRDAPPRLRSMRDAIAWSFELLSTDERALFRTLSVFEGGFTLDAVEGVSPDTLQSPALSVLFALMDHSLVFIQDAIGEQTRYSMLETIREFAFESLTAAGADESTRDRHLDWFIEKVGNPTAESWLDHVGVSRFHLPGDQDNLRSALNYACEKGKFRQAAHIAWGLLRYWSQYGQHIEALAALRLLLGHASELEPELVAGILIRQAYFEFMSGNLATSIGLSAASLDLCRQRNYTTGVSASLNAIGTMSKHVENNHAVDVLSEALSISRSLSNDVLVQADLSMRAYALIATDDLDLARRDATEAIALCARLPNSPQRLTTSQSALAWIAGRQGQIEEAESLAIEALAQSERFELNLFRCMSLRILGEVAFSRGQLSEAARWFQSSLEEIFQSTIFLLQGYNLAELAMVADARGDWRRAALLYGAAQASWDRFGFSMPEARTLCTWSDKHVPAPSSLLDEHYRSAYEAGKHLTNAEMVAVGMADFSAAQPTPSSSNVLTARELEVLRLVAAVHTNQEIGDLLFISKRTVDRHVLSLLSKLDAPNRRVAVRLAREAGILP